MGGKQGMAATGRGVALGLVLALTAGSAAASPPFGSRSRAQLRSAEPEPRGGLGLGLGLGASLSLGLGVGLLLQHRRGYAHFEAAPNNAGFVAALTASDVGSGFVGAGVGLGVAALGEGLRIGERGRWAELVIGGGLAVVGIAWFAREWAQVQRDLYAGGSGGGHDAGALHRETAAAAVLGAGVGLAAGAGVALLTRLLRGSRAQRTAARWGMVGSRGGLSLGGRF